MGWMLGEADADDDSPDSRLRDTAVEFLVDGSTAGGSGGAGRMGRTPLDGAVVVNMGTKSKFGIAAVGDTVRPVGADLVLVVLPGLLAFWTGALGADVGSMAGDDCVRVTAAVEDDEGVDGAVEMK